MHQGTTDIACHAERTFKRGRDLGKGRYGYGYVHVCAEYCVVAGCKVTGGRWVIELGCR
jgi:hypothetical protein